MDIPPEIEGRGLTPSTHTKRSMQVTLRAPQALFDDLGNEG
jgi:hypothetical protein